jgi:moderate conductance mechanosensitive channel
MGAMNTDSWPDWIVAILDFLTTFSGVARALGILIAGIILLWLVRRVINRVVDRVVSEVKKSEGVEDTQALQASPVEALRQVQRARTLGTVLNAFAGWTIWIVAAVMMLTELGVAVTPLVASLGILGAALGFGAQSLVKDMLNGLFMVFEDQLGVGDIVNLGTVTGVVERVGIRITEVRDPDGTVWYIRNGEILQVGNYSQDWARIILDIPVPYSLDVDEAQEALLAAAKQFATSPEWRRKVLEDPEMWGIESISHEALLVRLTVKVRAGEQFVLKRALHRFVKDALDIRGIDIPALNRMVVEDTSSRGSARRAAPDDAGTADKSDT